MFVLVKQINASGWESHSCLFLSTGERDVDALCQHRLCYHLCHRTRHRTQWVWPRQCLLTHRLQQAAPLAHVLLGYEQTCNGTCCGAAFSLSTHDTPQTNGVSSVFGLWITSSVFSRSHSLCGDHRDVQTVGSTRCLHGRRLRPLALKLYCWPRLPFPWGQLHNLWEGLLWGIKVFMLSCNRYRCFRYLISTVV